MVAGIQVSERELIPLRSFVVLGGEEVRMRTRGSLQGTVAVM